MTYSRTPTEFTDANNGPANADELQRRMLADATVLRFTGSVVAKARARRRTQPSIWGESFDRSDSVPAAIVIPMQRPEVADVAAAHAAKPTVKIVTLATKDALVEFRVDDAVVVVTRKSSVGDYPPEVGPWHRVTMPRDHARAEYRRLLNAGYWVW